MPNVIAAKRACDICGKEVDRWDITTISKLQKFPGKMYPRCSSDIRTNTAKLANLCPTCAETIESLINKHKKGDK